MMTSVRSARHLASALLVLGTTACLSRVDVGQVLRELPADAAQQRFAQVAASDACQARLTQDDAECWAFDTDADVAVETGVSRTLHGYLTSPYTVQTHLKVRLASPDADLPEVYYFADGGEGGLDQRAGYGRADGRVNVFCATTLTDPAHPGVDSNDLVQQAQVDAIAQCVHQAVLDGEGFGDRVKTCLQDLRTPAAQVAMGSPGDVRTAPPAGAALPNHATGVR